MALMQVEVDQSGKVEDTNQLTVVAAADGKSKSLVITAVEKQKLLVAARELDRPRKTYVYKIFAALIFLLVKNENITSLHIDREYPGHDGTIKNVLHTLLDQAGWSTPRVSFTLVTKKSPAHKIAVEVFRGNEEPDMIVTAEDALGLLYS